MNENEITLTKAMAVLLENLKSEKAMSNYYRQECVNKDYTINEKNTEIAVQRAKISDLTSRILELEGSDALE